MNIHYHDGCFGGYYTIDGKELKDLTEDEKKNVWLRAVNHLRMNPKMDSFQYLIELVMDTYGICDVAEEPCPTCGHWEEDIDFNL